ncbi:MAG: efflux RND transporter permease subunit [Methylovirgula sp.]
MALNVSALSIRNPLPAVVFALTVLALGAVSFAKLPITLLPNVDPPIVSVVVTEFGATPSELESQVTDKIENAVAGVAGIRHVTSSVSDGISATTIVFNLDVDTAKALAAVKDAVKSANLPQSASAPQVCRVDAVGLGIETYAAIAPGKSPEQLSYFVDNVVVGKLKSVEGVSAVERIGGVQREVQVSLDPERLQNLGLSAAQVNRRMQGAIDGQGADGPAALAQIKIDLPHGGQDRLADLGTIKDTIAEPRTFARWNGEPVVAFSILRAKGASDVGVAARVKKLIDQIKAEHPEFDLKRIDSSVSYTLGNYDAALHTFFEGAALAVIVVFLFLRDFRATAIAAIALPLSIIPAFWVMRIFGFSLNLVSLLAITLATGILVDDAIVEIENIVRHMRLGKSAYKAAMEAADEIGLAVIAISLTIVAVFVPVSFMGNVAGQYFKQFGLTIAAEVLFSLIAARLITPMLAAYFLKPDGRKEKTSALIERYGSLVEWSVVNRYKSVLVGLVLFALSILSITTNLVSRDFQPTQDSGRSHLAIELPPGSVLADTRRVTDMVSDRLRKRPEVVSVLVDGGRIPPGTPEVRKAELVVNYVPKSERRHSVQQLQSAIGKDLVDIPGIKFWFVDDYGMRPVSRIVTGRDGAAVAATAGELADEMRRMALISNVAASTNLDRSELRIEPNGSLAAHLGVASEALNETIRIATIGDVAAAKLRIGEQQIPIRLQLMSRPDPRILGILNVPTTQGTSVPLASVAKIENVEGPVSIDHFDRERASSVAADLVDGAALGDVEKALNALPVMRHLPPGVSVRKSANGEAMDELSSGFGDAMRNGLIMVYVVLVVLFSSFLQPITILFSLPLSIGGAVLALLVTGRPLSLPVIIGILMLMGIVTKNAIMLVDFSVRSIQRGMPRTAALVEAGKKRARPIIMTTVAMVAGMLPSALGFGAGVEFRSPMAIAVIGGLLVSTFLSLLFVPAFFAVVDDLRLFLQRAWAALNAEANYLPEPVGREPGGTPAE